MDLPIEILDKILRQIQWQFHLSQVVFVNGILGDIATKILQERLDKERADLVVENGGWPAEEAEYEEVYPAALRDVAMMKYNKVCSILTIFINS